MNDKKSIPLIRWFKLVMTKLQRTMFSRKSRAWLLSLAAICTIVDVATAGAWGIRGLFQSKQVDVEDVSTNDETSSEIEAPILLNTVNDLLKEHKNESN